MTISHKDSSEPDMHPEVNLKPTIHLLQYGNLMVIGAFLVSSAPPCSRQISLCNLVSLCKFTFSYKCTHHFFRSQIDKCCVYHHEVTVHLALKLCWSDTHQHSNLEKKSGKDQRMITVIAALEN